MTDALWAYGEARACAGCGAPRRRWKKLGGPLPYVVHVAATPERDPASGLALSQHCGSCGGPFDLAMLGERGPIVGRDGVWGFGAWWSPGTRVVVLGEIGRLTALSPAEYDPARHPGAVPCSQRDVPLSRQHPRLWWRRGAEVKVVGYARVSTELQAAEGYGLDVQVAAIRAWAKKNGHKLVTVELDEGVSGAETPEVRNGLAKALAMLETGQAQALCVARLDRLARDLVLQEQLLGMAKRSGARVVSCEPTENAVIDDDDEDPSRRLIRQVLGAVAEYERALVKLRLKRGRLAKKAAGGYAGGAPPYGWRARGRELEQDPAEQAVVARIVGLRGAGLSLRGIVAELEAAGVGPRRGSWKAQTVREVLIRAGHAERTPHDLAKRGGGSALSRKSPRPADRALLSATAFQPEEVPAPNR